MNESGGRKTVSHSISGAFVFLLLGVFALFGIAMVLLGVKAYRKTSERSGVHNLSRITSSYLRSMVRSDDENGNIRIEEPDGLPVITLSATYEGEEYLTRIYVYEGMLYEYFMDASEPFKPENGDAICAAEEMQASLSEGLLDIRVRSEGEWQDVAVALRTASGEVNR